MTIAARRCLGLMVAVASFGAVPSLAVADGQQWRGGWIDAYVRDIGVSNTTLTMSKGWADGSNHKVGVSAHLPGQNLAYTGMTTAWTVACQSYTGGNRNLGPMVENPHSVPQNPLLGIKGWLGGNGPTYC